MLSDPADISDTKIFTCLTDDDQQFIVYSNEVTTKSDNNVMILPVPYPNSVKFYDLSSDKSKNFFKDMNKFVESLKPRTRGLSLGLESASSYSLKDSEKLEVFSVGSYKVSIVPDINKFDNVDTTEFDINISNDFKFLLNKYYSQSYMGFLVFKLKKGTVDYSPFGYSHDIPVQDQVKKIFVPTRHRHGHQQRSRNYMSWTKSNDPNESSEELFGDYDHSIYALNMVIDSIKAKPLIETTSKIDLQTGIPYNDHHSVRTKKEEYSIEDNKDLFVLSRIFDDLGLDIKRPKSVSRYTINGSGENMDIFLKVC
jgi:hypothetical protein